MERRQFLRGLVATGAAVAAAPSTAAAAALRSRDPPPDLVGMLFDSTRCIGCKACVVACREANHLPPTLLPEDGKLHDMQTELDGTTKNVIKLYRDPDDPNVHAFMKQQCMHCMEPACVSACMLSALHKEQGGVVAYDADKCIGCRYCQVACPFNIPKFEWDNVLTPKIVKCELCKERLAQGKQPACTSVCPRQAVVFGRLAELRAEAHRRINAQPSRYQPRVYGEEEAGGTQVLYLSGVPFAKLGLPELGSESLPALSERLMHGVYQGLVTPLLLYVGLAVAVVHNWRAEKNGNGNGKEKP